MTNREKIGQLFIIRPDFIINNKTLRLGWSSRKDNILYPCGGYILFEDHILSPNQLKKLTSSLHKLKNHPLICIDEEGGTVAQICKNESFHIPKIPNMCDIGKTLDSENAFSIGNTIGQYLFKYGIDINFAPVADVISNKLNKCIELRAFSSNPEIVTNMVLSFIKGLTSHHVAGCLKHFPGLGGSLNDTHINRVNDLRMWEDFKYCDLLPFQKGIVNGVDLIMVSHLSLPNVTEDTSPASLSPIIINKLRNELGFNGVIITDSMEMGAITKHYSIEEATVKALKAGVDLILLPRDYKKAFHAVEKAIKDGELSMERIDQSVSRILAFKKKIYRCQ